MPTPELDAYLRTVASVYDAVQATPDDGRMNAYYAALRQELLAQYQVLTAFVNVTFTDVDPYGDSAEMFEGIRRGALIVYTGGELPTGHPFTLPAIEGQNYNVIFRAVHDGFAHYPERNSFGRVGEFRAFKAHARLLSWNSIQALFTETVAQNAWFHFGPESHRRPKPFAPQKALLMPETLIRQALTLEV